MFVAVGVIFAGLKVGVDVYDGDHDPVVALLAVVLVLVGFGLLRSPRWPR